MRVRLGAVVAWLRDLRATGMLSLVMAASLLIGGCAPGGMSSGMSGVLDAARIETSSRNVSGVLGALQRDASLGEYKASWYDVAVAGFNFVDRQCVDYFNDLFFIERKRDATRAALAAFGQTTDAILLATGATKITISVVAQAFGLAQNVTDIVANSFLYKLPPGTTMGFVREMQSAYRIGVAQQPARINSPVEAYHEIQRYLELCLPPTIEARLVDHISGAKAIAVASAGDTQVVVGSEISPEERVKIAAVLSGPQAPVVPQPPYPPGLKYITGGRTPTENEILLAVGQRMQRMLCVAASDGDFASADFRARLREFDTGNKFGTGQAPDDLIDGRREASLIKQAADNLKGCGSNHLSAFEAGFLFNETDPFKSTNRKLRCILLNSTEPGISENSKDISLGEIGRAAYTSTHRSAYSLASTHFKIQNGSQLTSELVTKIAEASVADVECLAKR